MIIECPYCESKVDGISKGEYEYQPEHYDDVVKIVLLKCPVCHEALLGFQEWYQINADRGEWSQPLNRLWPEPEASIVLHLPEIIGVSFEEAQRCYRAKAYMACAVMCGRALEGICNKYNTKNRMLAGGLKELLDQKIIDERLFKWGEELRKHRNIAAHATEEKISKEDAKDLLEFVTAICEYVFVLDEKFQKFMERKAAKTAG
ncbi:MAG: hypothetical protein BroJett011_51600 [Chloroflexota bacterium]|nr:MAG: hypothetical protein BroJett011_51600 [Chloroflexota bacterium]